ncbi:M48 family metallopeptidase [Actinomyces bowdenii]|uniref:M48 family metallopeptidase n=1 Tax=Actinomyces bowdenii TaxID=131109 RepID=A0A853EJH2_9ACTO|nr:M48 family metallopeptidase [Actinomyces bowdenii]MBF0697246.1 M48 family metallopeptidase [Actinomyces bowdenii]NYS69419.1 M48 family metallopeptidase [Actinomyces bowdenii]
MTFTPTPAPMTPGATPTPGPSSPAIKRPTLFNGATTHGMMGIRQLRHRCEIPLVIADSIVAVLLYAAWIALIVWLITVPEPSGMAAEVRETILSGGTGSEVLLALPALPLIIWVGRAMLYAGLRAKSVQMSPTQFPEGYRMVVEAARAYGLRRVPDAYVVLGQGQINAFASGHGFRRFVAVNSDLFEVGGKTRDPEALRFVIGHEVGHLAAGHTSFGRTLLMVLIGQIPLLGPALSRAQEYTADNHGYSQAPQGVAGAIGLLGAGKYLGAQVNLHAVADRATRERGWWLHLANWLSSHPVLTWRAHALRDRSRHGRLMIRPPESTAWFPPVRRAGSEFSHHWPTPSEVLAELDSTAPRLHAEEQFGRYPGLTYDLPRDALRLSDPTPVPLAGAAQPAGPGVGSGAPDGGAAGAPTGPGAAPGSGASAASPAGYGITPAGTAGTTGHGAAPTGVAGSDRAGQAPDPDPGPPSGPGSDAGPES